MMRTHCDINVVFLSRLFQATCTSDYPVTIFIDN